MTFWVAVGGWRVEGGGWRLGSGGWGVEVGGWRLEGGGWGVEGGGWRVEDRLRFGVYVFRRSFLAEQFIVPAHCDLR
jgi:hypothetical protein